MKLLPMAAVLGALALGGCATFTTLFGGSPANAATLVDAEKALTVAHLAYQGAGIALEQAAQSGALTVANAATAETLYDKAGDALDVADAADEAANASGILAAVADAEAALSSLNTLIKK
jgi:hypothetical protein